MKKSGFIAIIGRPNAGKSTLLNTVLDSELSIVTPKAQTTRERVTGILTQPQGQMVFVDTPGIHKARSGGFNSFMVSEAKEALDSPDLIWYLVDPGSALQHEQAVIDLLKGNTSPLVLLLTKSDRVDRVPALEAALIEALQAAGVQPVKVLSISARSGNGIQELMELSWDKLPEGPAFYPDETQISDRPVRFFVAEKIREQVFLKLGEEIPYSCAIQIEKYDEKAVPPRIEAYIHVERESQKGMVIGQGGKKIKEIGTAAREQIEAFLGNKVFLGLQVKVLTEWSRDPELMKRLGYVLPKKGKAS